MGKTHYCGALYYVCHRCRSSDLRIKALIPKLSLLAGLTPLSIPDVAPGAPTWDPQASAPGTAASRSGGGLQSHFYRLRVRRPSGCPKTTSYSLKWLCDSISSRFSVGVYRRHRPNHDTVFHRLPRHYRKAPRGLCIEERQARTRRPPDL
jgi:hypothetical protein